MKYWLTEIAKECRMSCFLFFCFGLGLFFWFGFFCQTRYCTVRPTAAGLYTPESIPQTIPCVCLVSGCFYRTMQQWGFQKQALVDVPQALFIPARSFSRSCGLSHAWHSLKKLLWELKQIIWESNIKGSTDNKINTKIRILA